METKRVDVLVHDDDDGLWAEVPEIPGVFATGETTEELLESLQEGLSLVLDLDVKIIEVEGRPRRSVSTGPLIPGPRTVNEDDQVNERVELLVTC